MQLVSTLLYLALSIFSANAFYPYGPAWQKELDNGIDVKKGRNDAASGSSDSVTLRLKQRTTHRTVKSHNQRATAEAARLSQKFNGQDALVRRKNAYRVTSATTPSTSDATGIDQDGNDFSYFIEVGLGSKKAKYYMLVDTGAGSSWVMGFECTDEACSKHNTLGPDSSSSLEISDKEFSVSYGTGKVKGKLATDTVSIAGMDLKYKFGLASSTSEEFSKFAFDGIIGLSMANGASDNFLSTLASSGEIKNNVFSVSLSRASDGGSSGEIKFGGTNPAKYTGDITYNSLQSKGDEWAITMDDMSFDGKKANVGGKLAYIDTGTTYVFGPESLVDKLHGVIEGATKHGTYYSVSCDLTKPITVTFSGVDYDIPAKDWITPKDGNGNCFSNIYGQEVVKDSWLMGGTFLKSVYTVYDKDGKRIGFARGTDNADASSSTSEPSSSTQSSTLDSTLASTSSTSATSSSAPESTSNSLQGLTGQETESAGALGSPTSSAAATANTDHKKNAAVPRLPGTEDDFAFTSNPRTESMIQGKRGGSSAGAESWNGGEDRQSLLDGNNHDERENSGGDGGGGQSKVAADAIDDIVQIQVPGRVRLNDMPEMARLDKAIAGHGRSDDGSGYDDDDDLHATLDLEDPLRDHDDDYDDGDDDYDDHDHDHDAELPLLLTGIEAPAVALANDLDRQDDAADAVAREMRRPKSGLASAFMNMANSIIGAGIIGQPYALRQAGLLAGVVLLVGLTAMVDWTVRLLVINSKLSGTSSFQGTVAHCFGRPGLVAISLAQWVFAFGGMVAFGVIIGDTIPHVLMAAWPGLAGVPVVGLMTDRRVAIAVLVLGVSLPLTLYRDIAKLAKASTFALVGMVVIVTTVLVQGFLVPSEARGGFSLPLLTVNDGIFQAIGVISFAFVCHHNSLLIYGSLRKPTIDNFSRVTHYSTGVSMLACLAMGLGGFLAFGNRTLGNVLNNLPSDSGAVNGARLLFGLNMLTTLPLEAFVCREVMVTYWWPGEGFSMRRHVALSTGLVAAAVGLSVATCDLGAVFELVGATSAVAMAFILPPLCYLRLATRSWRTYLAVSVVAFGALVMVISVAQAVRKLVNGTGDAVQCH